MSTCAETKANGCTYEYTHTYMYICAVNRYVYKYLFIRVGMFNIKIIISFLLFLTTFADTNNTADPRLRSSLAHTDCRHLRLLYMFMLMYDWYISRTVGSESNQHSILNYCPQISLNFCLVFMDLMCRNF